MGTIKIAICGLGESIREFNGGFDVTIGVNDIWRIVKTDYVVCVDRPDRFVPDRLDIINNCSPLHFYSQLDEWKHRPDFHRIELQHDYPNNIVQLDIPAIPKSFCSPFVAAAIAYKLHGANEIHLFGVDLINHPLLKTRSVERIVRHFTILRDEFIERGITFHVHGNGALRSLNNDV